MEAELEFTAALCRAARALVQWPREQLAEASGVSKKTIRDFETGGAALDRKSAKALRLALEAAGAVFLDEDDMGAGVRLRFTRRDVKQINRLEGEGGVVGDDDV